MNKKTTDMHDTEAVEFEKVEFADLKDTVVNAFKVKYLQCGDAKSIAITSIQIRTKKCFVFDSLIVSGYFYFSDIRIEGACCFKV